MMYYGGGMGGWGMILITVSSFLFWALTIAGVVALVRYIGAGTARDRQPTRGPTPRQTLAERFARGDIDADEYQQRLQVLDATTRG